MNTKKRNGGFTLAEVIVAGTISVLVMGFTLDFHISSMRTLMQDMQRIDLDAVVRKFTGKLGRETLDANDVYIMPGIASFDGNADLTRTVVGSLPVNLPVAAGGSGDALVLVYRDDPSNQTLITRIRIYYRATADPTVGALIRTVYREIPAGSQTQPLNTLINDSGLIPRLASDYAGQPAVVELKAYALTVTQAGTPVTLPIFYFNNSGGPWSAVSVNCRFEPDNNGTGLNRKTAMSFNYTIAPRK